MMMDLLILLERLNLKLFPSSYCLVSWWATIVLPKWFGIFQLSNDPFNSVPTSLDIEFDIRCTIIIKVNP